MTYKIKLYSSEDISDVERQAAEQRFRRALTTSLGDDSLVAPMYTAYLRIVTIYGESPDLDSLTEAEQLIFTRWHDAQASATAAAFGSHRYMGDAVFEFDI